MSDSVAVNDSFSAFNFNEMISEILLIISHCTPEKQLLFFYDICPSIPPSLIGDEKGLKQAIVDFLMNVIKFTKDDGEVNLVVNILETSGENITLQFDITDTGTDIPPEKQSEISDILEQVVMMSGKVKVESEPGKGSRFIFTFKLKVDSDTKTPDGCLFSRSLGQGAIVTTACEPTSDS